MADSLTFPQEGGCVCGKVRYKVTSAPLVVNCCHCRWCQRETGASFALNAIYEADRVVHIASEPLVTKIPSVSGKGQLIARCPDCFVVIWSNYSFDGPFTRILRVGTLGKPDLMPPDAHIFTDTKQPWVDLGRTPAFKGYYDLGKIWKKESLERKKVLVPEIEKWKSMTGGQL